MSEHAEAFEEDEPRIPLREEGEDGDSEYDPLLLNIDGFEGPIDVLLVMARDQKVDLTKISILQLARQYLAFVDRATHMKLELAAEYLVMAAWLAYLKSRLLLPRENNGAEPDAQAMAEALQFQLRRLEAMQKAAQDLLALPQLGRDIFGRGMPEAVQVDTDTVWDATLYDLLRAYGDIARRKDKTTGYVMPTFKVMSLEDAMERMGNMLGKLPRNGPFSVWTTLQSFMPQKVTDKLYFRSSMASLMTAGLELVKQGRMELKQDAPFRPIYMRAKEPTAAMTQDNEQVSEDQSVTEEQEYDHTGTN
jgi:segregation and condensation protein A